MGLSPECKDILINFFENGFHTLRGGPLTPPVRLLVKQGILFVGPGGGTYDAVDSYVSVSKNVWGVMNKWVNKDTEVIQEILTRADERSE